MKSLEVINVAKNKLKQLPKGIRSLENLKEFIFYKNKLKTLPADFHYLNNLQTIGIDWFHYTSPPLAAFYSNNAT